MAMKIYRLEAVNGAIYLLLPDLDQLSDEKHDILCDVAECDTVEQMIALVRLNNLSMVADPRKTGTEEVLVTRL